METWRPTGRKVVDRMRRFFIGGTPEIDDITFVACPRDFNVSQVQFYKEGCNWW